MKYIVVVILSLGLFACKGESSKKNQTLNKNWTAQTIIDEAIAVSGGENFGNSSIAFKFRDIYYTARRQKGDFSLSRIQTINGDSVIDILSNEGLARFINNEFQNLSEEEGSKYAASVNSVHYFSILPYGLNDKAVIKRSLGQERINDKNYYKIEITFSANGGGEDFEDVFIYWIDVDTFKVDYLAYSYEEEEGVGLRFREAYNERYVEGLRFVDYYNYKPENPQIQLESLAKAYSEGQLKLLSKIDLEKVQVQLF